MVGKLRSTVIDCREPRQVAFQLSPEHDPPQFPDPHVSQQFHLDVAVDDVDAAGREVLALGATRVTDAAEDNLFRVYRDPAGHPFCLVWGVTDQQK